MRNVGDDSPARETALQIPTSDTNPMQVKAPAANCSPRPFGASTGSLPCRVFRAHSEPAPAQSTCAARACRLPRFRKPEPAYRPSRRRICRKSMQAGRAGLPTSAWVMALPCAASRPSSTRPECWNRFSSAAWKTALCRPGYRAGNKARSGTSQSAPQRLPNPRSKALRPIQPQPCCHRPSRQISNGRPGN